MATKRIIVKKSGDNAMVRSVLEPGAFADENEEDEDTVLIEETEEQTIKRLLAESERESQFDLFANLGAPLMDRGLCLKYMIQRSGTVVGWRSHPYSWEMLKTEFGGGSYTVTAKHPHTNVFVKKQSMSLEGRPLTPAEEPDKPAAQQFPFPFQPPQQTDVAAILTPVLQMLTQLAVPKADTGTAEIIKAMQASNQTQFQMMQQMMQAIGESNMRQSQFQMQMMEKMNDRIEAVMRKEGDKFSANDILKATQDAQEAGFRLFAQLQTMATQVAEEKLAQLPEAAPQRGMIDTLIEGLAPMVLQSMTGVKAASLPSQAPRPVQSGGQINPNGVNFPKVNLPQRQSQPVQRQGATMAPRPTAPAAPAPAKQPSRIAGLPTLDANTAAPTYKQTQTAAAVPANIEKWLPGMMVCFQTAWGVAGGDESLFRQAVGAELDKAGFDYVTFVKEVSRADITNFAKAQAPQALPIFEALYGDFEAKAGMVGTSTAQSSLNSVVSPATIEPSSPVTREPTIDA